MRMNVSKLIAVIGGVILPVLCQAAPVGYSTILGCTPYGAIEGFCTVEKGPSDPQTYIDWVCTLTVWEGGSELIADKYWVSGDPVLPYRSTSDDSPDLSTSIDEGKKYCVVNASWVRYPWVRLSHRKCKTIREG